MTAVFYYCLGKYILSEGREEEIQLAERDGDWTKQTKENRKSHYYSIKVCRRVYVDEDGVSVSGSRHSSINQ